MQTDKNADGCKYANFRLKLPRPDVGCQEKHESSKWSRTTKKAS